MRVFKEKHFFVGNFRLIAGVAFLLILATTLFIVGKELTTGAILGIHVP